MNTRRPANPYTNPNHGLHAQCRPVDFIAATLVTTLVTAVLLTSLDGMLADTVRPVATHLEPQ